MDAVMHFGPRPVFKDTPACEVHLLDQVIEHVPDRIIVEVIALIRKVQDFPSVDDLKAQIAQDIEDTRAMLAAHPA
jgi:FAD synthase